MLSCIPQQLMCNTGPWHCTYRDPLRYSTPGKECHHDKCLGLAQNPYNFCSCHFKCQSSVNQGSYNVKQLHVQQFCQYNTSLKTHYVTIDLYLQILPLSAPGPNDQEWSRGVWQPVLSWWQVPRRSHQWHGAVRVLQALGAWCLPRVRGGRQLPRWWHQALVWVSQSPPLSGKKGMHNCCTTPNWFTTISKEIFKINYPNYIFSRAKYCLKTLLTEVRKKRAELKVRIKKWMELIRGITSPSSAIGGHILNLILIMYKFAISTCRTCWSR